MMRALSITFVSDNSSLSALSKSLRIDLSSTVNMMLDGLMPNLVVS